MYKNNYANSDTKVDNTLIPEWLNEALNAEKLSTQTKDRIGWHFREQQGISPYEAGLIRECFRKPEIEKPELILPNDSQNIHDSAEVLFKHLASTNDYFRQGKSLVKLRRHDSEDGERLEEVTAEAFRSILGEYFDCQAIIQGDRGQYMRHKLCSLDNAKALLAANAFNLMPKIQAVLRSPVFAEDDDAQLIVLSKGYHRANGGTFILSDKDIQTTIGIKEAREALRAITESCG